MVFPKPFTTTSSTIASFSFEDIADGTGIISFDGAKSVTSSGDNYLLTTQKIYSNDIQTDSVAIPSNNVWVKVIDKDFDVVLNSSRILKGTCFINALSSGTYVGGVGGSHSSKMIFHIRKWDGSTETTLSTIETETKTSTILSGRIIKEWLVDVVLSRTHFAKGEIIRVTAELWGKRSVDGSVAGNFAHDPMKRETTTFPTDADYDTSFKINIPFLIEL